MNKLMIINTIAAIGCLLLLVSNSLKKEKAMMTGQMISAVFLAAADFLAGSITGMSISVLSIGRNVLCMKDKLNKAQKAVIITLSVLIGIFANHNGLIGLLPSAANIINTAFMKNELRRLKLIVLLTSVLWLMHDLYMGVYVTCVLDVISIVTSAIFLIRIAKNPVNGENKETIAA